MDVDASQRDLLVPLVVFAISLVAVILGPIGLYLARIISMRTALMIVAAGVLVLAGIVVREVAQGKITFYYYESKK